MNTTYENLRQRAKGLYAAGLAAIVVGSLPTIFGGALITSPVGFLAANPFKTWAAFWVGLVVVGLGFVWLLSGLVTAALAVQLQPLAQASAPQYPAPPWVQQRR